MNPKNNILLQYENSWIAADKEYKKVYAANKNLDDLQKEISRLKIRDVVIMFVPPFDATLSPSCP